MLAFKRIDVKVSNDKNQLVIDFMFLQEKYFTITIWKNNENKIFSNQKYEDFGHGGGGFMPLSEFYLSLYSVCDTIHGDIMKAINK